MRSSYPVNQLILFQANSITKTVVDTIDFYVLLPLFGELSLVFHVGV